MPRNKTIRNNRKKESFTSHTLMNYFQHKTPQYATEITSDSIIGSIQIHKKLYNSP